MTNPHCVMAGFKPWKDSIGFRNAELIWLAICCLDRRAEPSNFKLANKEFGPGARAMPAIHFTALHHLLGLRGLP